MQSRLRLIELTAALSLATDAGTGQPLEHALRTAVLARRAGEHLGLSASQQSTVLYTTLLRFLGCTADASATAVMVGGDEIAFNAGLGSMVMADDHEALPQVLRLVGAELPLGRRIGRVAAVLTDPGGKARSLSQHCEVGARLGARVGLPSAVIDGLAHAYERWDGKGLPDGLAGDAIPLATRVMVVARDVDLLTRRLGWGGAMGPLRRRRGTSYDPAVVDAFTADGARWLADLEAVDPWDDVVAAEPDPVFDVGDDHLDGVLTAFADFTDLKSPWFVGHSRAVSALAERAAEAAGLDASAVVRARRVGLVHDLGIVGVPSGVWDRTGPISAEAWERVRLHPYAAERILGRSEALSDLAADAGAHHERVGGSGYHRGTREVSLGAQVVAVADVYTALGENRPHRRAMAPDAARRVLLGEADGGRFARAAVDAVFAAAGQTPGVPNVARPAGLTEREVDVLRLVARGLSNKEAACELGISAKTVGTHIEHIYAKAGVRTRAGVTVFAMEHDLVHR